MERISAFMDGELEDHEASGQLKRLKDSAELRAAWGTYHLIGDAMRGEAGYSSDLVARIGAKLAAEPTVLAPRPLLRFRNVRRLALSAAASVGGVALVAWLTLFENPFFPRQDLAVTQPSGAQTQLAATPANGAVNDYLLAHQQFSPSTAMQGVASYVRTVSGQNSEQR
jgi:sigma-E factor negative regulatory protein RseA